MPDSRPADSYLSYADDSVFLDFNHTDDIVRLIRISFDGYGCCTIPCESIRLLNPSNNKEYLKMYHSGNIDQVRMKTIITKLIQKNKKYIWNDALREYGLI